MHCDSRRTVCITKEPPGSVHVGRHWDVLQLGEHLGQDKEGDVLVGPVGGVGGDGGSLRTSACRGSCPYGTLYWSVQG